MRLRAPWLAPLLFLLLAASRPAAAQIVDADGDTMPDAWETFFGLNPNDPADAAGDADGDGQTNAQEFAAGRHPGGLFARYFAEGSTGYFQTSLSVLNLSPTATAHVNVALLDEMGGVTAHQLTLGPRARRSVPLDTILAAAGAVSIIVESDVAIAADRVMTWGPGGIGLSLDSGAPAPSTTWYFAEGATGPFLLYYLFENPGTTPATVTLRYLREGGSPVVRTRTLAPHSRTTVFVNGDDPALASASLGAVVTSDVPILAERAMYLQSGGTFAGGSASSGSPTLSTQWYFGEGATGPFFHAFLSLLNPGTTPVVATVTYHLSDGSTASKAYTVPAEGRRTVYFNGEADTDPALAALASGPVWFTISSTQPILGERAMWWADWPWYEGHAAAGSTTSDVAWGVAEGRDGGPDGDQTYVLVGNTTGTAGQVRVSLIPDTGATQTRDLTIAPGARLTINVGGLFGLTGASRFSVTVESIGTTPVPLAVDYARYRSLNGLPFSGGGAAPAVPLLPADAPPAVASSVPANGATGVSATADLTVTFTEPVTVTAQAFSLTCGNTAIPLQNLTVVPNASQYVLHPSAGFLPPSTACTLTVAAGQVADSDATDPPDVMTADAVVGFTTAAESAPTVASTAPAAGATQVGTGASLTLTFSEPVDVAGNWFQIACATSGTRGVADTVVSGGPTTFTIDPAADFTAGEACVVTVDAAQVTDQDPIDPPDAMAANHVFAFTVDVAPTVSLTAPANGATQVATTATIGVTFSEPVTATGAWAQVACATSGAHAVTLSGGPTAFLVDPDVDFAAGELCTVTIVAAQIADQDAGDPPDTMAANHVFSFTTDAPPSVVSTTPADGATQVGSLATIAVTFSEPVIAAAGDFQLSCNSTPVAFTLSASPATAFTLTPAAPLSAGQTCTVAIAPGVIADLDAADPPDVMPASYVFTFTIDAAPMVTAVTPADGSTTSTSANVTVTFSEPVTVSGSWFSIVCATSGTRTIANAVVTGGPTTFTINPTADFAGGESCTATIVAAQVADQDAADPPDTPAADFVFSFTADAAPAVTSTSPLNGATVTASANLTVTFSEAVNAAIGSFTLTCGVSGAHAFALSGGPTAWTLNPTTDFTAGETCTWTVLAAGITDQDATDPPDTMAANHVLTFTIDAQPAVTATTPANGAVQIGTTANVTVTFSEPVDVAGSAFSVGCSVSGAHAVTVTGGPTAFTLDPTTDFVSGDVCTVTVVAAQITDQDAIDPPDAMAANHVFSFTVDSAPAVVGTLPAHLATGVATSATVSVTFTENVNVTTSSFTLVCGGTPVAYTLSSSPASSITLTPTGGLPAGVSCTVTVVAAQVTDADAGDPPDAMLANHVFSFTVPPDAVNDTRGVTGNVSINTATTSFSVLGNDVGPGITVTGFDATSLRGGTVGVNGAGVFTYTPPVGYEGTDSFTYTIGNAAGSDTATVTLTISGMLWVIDNTASACTTIAGGCGRVGTPFSSLAAFNAVNGGATSSGGDVIDPEAGDHIFLRTGAGSYAGPLVLRNDQRLIGQGATSPLAALAGLTFAPDSVNLPTTGGTSPVVTSAGSGITLAQNNALHGLTLSNTVGTALSGVAFGTFTASENVVISTTTAVPVSLSGGTLAASLRSVSANGAANGIVLVNTSGSFAVTGAGTAGSGGTIQNTAGANGATTGIGVYLLNAQGVSLGRMIIRNHANFGIWGSGVNGFSLTNSTVDGVNGQYVIGNTPDNREGSVALRQLTGTVVLSGNTIQGGAQDNVNIINESGTLASLQITGNTIQTNDATNGEDGIWLQARNTAVLSSVTIASNQFNFHRGDHLDIRSQNSAAMTLALTGNTMVGDGGTTEGGTSLGSSVLLFAGDDADLTFNVTGNTMRGSVVTALSIGHSGLSSAASDLRGTVSNNTIGLPGVQDSGSAQGPDIAVDARGAGRTIVAVTNNQLYQYNNQGIIVSAGEGNPTAAEITVTGNTIANPGTFATNGFHLNAGPLSTDTFTMCLHLSGNSITGGGVNNGAGTEDFRLRQRRANLGVRLPGYTGGTDDTAAVIAFVQGANPTSPTGSAVATGGGTGGFLGGASCQAP